jgi:hypothetical protein
LWPIMLILTTVVGIVNEERSAAVLNVLRRVGAGNASREKAAKSKYEANTPKRCYVKKFIARWPGGSQNGKW